MAKHRPEPVVKEPRPPASRPQSFGGRSARLGPPRWPARTSPSTGCVRPSGCLCVDSWGLRVLAVTKAGLSPAVLSEQRSGGGGEGAGICRFYPQADSHCYHNPWGHFYRFAN